MAEPGPRRGRSVGEQPGAEEVDLGDLDRVGGARGDAGHVEQGVHGAVDRRRHGGDGVGVGQIQGVELLHGDGRFLQVETDHFGAELAQLAGGLLAHPRGQPVTTTRRPSYLQSSFTVPSVRRPDPWLGAALTHVAKLASRIRVVPDSASARVTFTGGAS